MKKKIVIAILAAGSALSMTQAFAAAGTVNFNGNILMPPATSMSRQRTRWLFWAIIIKLNFR